MSSRETLHGGLIDALDGPVRRALSDHRGKMSNVELLAEANRWRAGIQRMIPGNHRPVAVLGEKSCMAVAAIIGVLMSGRAFSTFDPIEKCPRVRSRLQALRPSAILDLDKVGDGWGLCSIAPVIDDVQSIAPDDAKPVLDASGLAYVLFTSGSTGAPRGVAVGHRAATLARAAYLQAAEIKPGDVVANDIPLIFDVATLDVLGGLAAGAEISLIPLQATDSARALHESLRGSQASIGFTVPTVADLLFADFRPPVSLRRLFLTGEKVGARLAERLSRLSLDVINAYGMTEAPWVASGRLAAGRNVFELPANDDPVQVRIAEDGEIILRGPGLHSAIITPDMPLDTDIGPVSSYSTGDFGTLIGSGRFQFLGRRDRHIRFEGFRIELGEIESVVENFAPEVLAYASFNERDGSLNVQISPRIESQDLFIASVRERSLKALPGFLPPLRWSVMPKAQRTATGKKDHSEAMPHAAEK